jgi:hypothetical protein
VRWLRCFYAEEALWCFFEVDEDDDVVRHVEVRTAGGRPVTAASLAEVLHLRDNADLAAMQRYEERYGVLAEAGPGIWAAAPVQEISADEFERAWRQARRVSRSRVTEN